MTNITHNVWRILDNDPSIRRELQRGLINTSALARYLIKERKIDATLDAIINAIRRYHHPDQYDDIFAKAAKTLSQAVNISTKSNLAEISLIKDTDIQKALADVFKIISYIQGDTLRIMQANNSIRLLIDEKNMERVLTLLPKNKIISKEMNLTEINIYIHPLMQKTPGILAVISNELSINGINIVEVMTCPPEMLFIVKKEDFQKASEVILELCQPMKQYRSQP
jgi:aspartokinase